MGHLLPTHHPLLLRLSVGTRRLRKKLITVVLPCERFHQYIYAKKTNVETEHQPLASTITKPLDKTPARLQCMLLRLQRYDVT